MAVTTEKLREARDWLNLILTIITVLIIPAGLLVLKNQRLEMAAENASRYVSIETYRSGMANLATENASLRSELTTLNGKMDKLQITLVRLTDAVRLKDP